MKYSGLCGLLFGMVLSTGALAVTNELTPDAVMQRNAEIRKMEAACSNQAGGTLVADAQGEPRCEVAQNRSKSQGQANNGKASEKSIDPKAKGR